MLTIDAPVLLAAIIKPWQGATSISENENLQFAQLDGDWWNKTLSQSFDEHEKKNGIRDLQREVEARKLLISRHRCMSI